MNDICTYQAFMNDVSTNLMTTYVQITGKLRTTYVQTENLAQVDRNEGLLYKNATMLQKSYHTKTSDLISQFISQNQEKGFTAGELSDFLHANDVTVNKTTVYRNLDKMTENGQLIKHKSMISDGFVYQAVEDEHHCEEHIHFQCCKCGSVIHLDDEKTSEYLKSISSELGLKIDLNLSSLNGICQKCRTQN